MRLWRAAAVLALLAVSSPLSAQPVFDTVSLPADRIQLPAGKPSSVVVLLSDAAGWSAGHEQVASRLAEQGAAVVRVDLPTYYAALRQETRDCLYLVSDIERLSRELFRAQGVDTYRPPFVAGTGEGATLALAIAAQTPASTLSALVAVDPGATVPLVKPLCTPAPKTPRDGGIGYGLVDGPLPAPVDLVFTSAASARGRAHGADLRLTHPDIRLEDSPKSASEALLAGLERAIRHQEVEGALPDLPLVEMPASGPSDVFAIIYSGDGGWRDIDRQLGLFIQQAGIPVVGVDALRYFWSEKTPDQTATDLSRIIRTYSAKFGARRVALIGYSFGADILPATIRRLPSSDQEAIRLVSLLALSRAADFEIAVTGWLGIAGAGRHGDPVEDARLIDPGKLQCIYGLAEKVSGCPALQPLAAAGADIIARPGGHHFDGNYRILADHILARLR